MKKFLWMAAIALVGCTHASVRTDSGGTVTTTTGVSASVSGQSGAAAWALIGIGLIAAEAANPALPSAPRPEVLPAAPRPGPLDERRRVNEVDCTKPIQDWSANLKCK